MLQTLATELIWEIGLAIEDEKDLLSFSLTCQRIHANLNNDASKAFWLRRFAQFYDLPVFGVMQPTAQGLASIVRKRYASILHPPSFFQSLTQENAECAMQALQLLREAYTGRTSKNIEALRHFSQTSQFMRLLNANQIRVLVVPYDCDRRADISQPGHNPASVYVEVACMMLHFSDFEGQSDTIDIVRRTRHLPSTLRTGLSNSILVMLRAMPEPFLSKPGIPMLSYQWLLHACGFWQHHLALDCSLGRYHDALDPSQRVRCWTDLPSASSGPVEIGNRFMASFAVETPYAWMSAEVLHANEVLDGHQLVLNLSLTYPKPNKTMYWPWQFERIVPAPRQTDNAIEWVEVRGGDLEHADG